MKIYAIIGDYGLNGHYIEDIDQEKKDLAKFIEKHNDALTKAKMMHPYMTYWSQWEINTETLKSVEVDHM